MDREAWRVTVHKVTKSWTWLNRWSTHASVTYWSLCIWILRWAWEVLWVSVADPCQQWARSSDAQLSLPKAIWSEKDGEEGGWQVPEAWLEGPSTSSLTPKCLWHMTGGESFYEGRWKCEKSELDHKEDWALKNWCFLIVVVEKTLESPLDFKEIKPVNHKGNQPWIVIGTIYAEAEAPILWPPDAKSWLTEKDSNVGKDWGQEEKGKTEDEMVGWHHWLDGHEFEQVLGVGDRQGSLACCSPWGHKESDTTERLNWTGL